MIKFMLLFMFSPKLRTLVGFEPQCPFLIATAGTKLGSVQIPLHLSLCTATLQMVRR